MLASTYWPTKGTDARSFADTFWNWVCCRSFRPARTARNPPTMTGICTGSAIWSNAFINKIKHYRRISSRFEKLDTRYLGFLHFTAALIWLR